MFEIVKLDVIHDILAPLVTEQLAASGFESVSRLKWVRSDDAPIRQIYEFHSWKGGAVAPSWGLSLDFVPHLAAGRLKWHRTAKSAIADIRIDSQNRSDDISYTSGVDEVKRVAGRVVERSVAEAQEFWRRFTKVDELPRAVDFMRTRLAKASGLGFYNYSQAPIASAVIYAIAGRRAEASHEMTRYLEIQKPDDEKRERLLSLLNHEPLVAPNSRLHPT